VGSEQGPRRPRWLQYLAQLDVDPGELHLRRFGHVEADRNLAEGGQDLRGAVDQVAQLTRIHRIRARAKTEMVELDIATGPREFDGIQLGPERLVDRDRARPVSFLASTPREPCDVLSRIVSTIALRAMPSVVGPRQDRAREPRRRSEFRSSCSGLRSP
jgi:hypothetical protein